MATLYRKYRSKTFDEVIGQDPIVTTLVNQIKLGRIGHAYLFAGTRGTGKTTCARIFARAVNCTSPVNGSPCGKCEACKKLSAPDNVDIIEMDAASNNGVDDARDIREKVKYMPVVGKYKVYIIDEVHMLTGGAFNALLKTLEEPPEHVIFILATTEPQKLPQTILSRCIRFDFKLVPTDILAAHISKIYDAEGVKYTAEAAQEIARLGEGSVRDALSVADMLASAADVITPEVVRSLTGAGDSARIAELFDAAALRDAANCLKLIDALGSSGKSMSAICRQLLAYARNVLVVKTTGKDADRLVNADKIAFDRIKASAEKADVQTIATLLTGFGNADNGLKYSVNPRLYLETSIVGMLFGVEEKEDMRRRIAALEKQLGSARPADQKKNIAVTSENMGASVASATRVDTAPAPAPAPQKQYAAPAQIVSPAPEKRRDYAPPPEYDMPEPPPEDIYSAVPPVADKPREKAPISASPEKTENRYASPKAADEGEFMHQRAKAADEDLELLGKVAIYLRKNGTEKAVRVRELLSRGVTVREREDAIAFIVPDDSFLLMNESSVTDVIDGALDACGIKKRAHIEKTEEGLFADDLSCAKEFFGRDNVVVNR